MYIRYHKFQAMIDIYATTGSYKGFTVIKRHISDTYVGSFVHILRKGSNRKLLHKLVTFILSLKKIIYCVALSLNNLWLPLGFGRSTIVALQYGASTVFILIPHSRTVSIYHQNSKVITKWNFCLQ